MLIDKNVLFINHEEKIDYNKLDMFEYTLEVASVMNDDISVFMEGLTGQRKIFDFERIVNAILDALINAIRKLFKTFLAFLAQLASMGSSFEIELRAFKDRIKALKTPVELDFPYYHYTNLSSEYPGEDIYKYIEDTIKRYSDEYNNFINRGGAAVTLISDLDGSIDPSVEQNRFRNILLNGKGDDKVEDFAVRLNEFFKNNNDIPINNERIDGERIYKEFYIPYIDSKKEISKIKREQNAVESKIHGVKSKINKNFFDLTKVNQFAPDDQSKITGSVVSIQRKLCATVDLMCQDILVMYGQKLQAYKEFKTQSRKVLVLAIKECVKQGG